MLENFSVTIQSITLNNSSPRFGDPIASQTEWTPLKTGGTTFRTHRLVSVGDERMEFKATTGALVFYIALFVVPLFFLAMFPFHRFPSGTFSMVVPKFLLGYGLYALIMGYFFHANILPVVFDKGQGLFWKGWMSPGEDIGDRWFRRCVALDEIHALQLIAGLVGNRKSRFYSYELNLVLKDGSRINLIDHGSREGAVEDGKALAAFLGKPLWDTTEGASWGNLLNGL